MNEINMTPLVDVMLVLLIIFIITVPVMKHSVNVDLPRASNQPEEVKPQNVSLSITADGKYHWNGSHLRRGTGDPPAGRSRQGSAARPAHPRRQGSALRARGPGHGCRPAAGVRKIGFVTDPVTK
jgi:biopolymer transport protein ExbD